MKKYTFYFICFLMAVVVTSCKKEKEEDSFLKGQMTDFHGQKAYIDGSNYSCFRQGETIFVNGRNNCTVSALSNSDRTCTISGAEEASGYYAFYPANLISATDISSGFSGATVTLPRVQTYMEEGGHQVIDNPMAGYLDESSGIIQFNNLCALLKVTVQSNWVQLDSIQMILKGTTLWGTGIVNTSTSDWKLDMSSGQTNHDTISLVFSSSVHPGSYTGEVFYIMVPEVVIADDPNLAEVQIRIFGKRAASTLANPKSYSISLSASRTVTHNNIQLFNKVYADTVIGVGVFTVAPAQNGQPARKVTFAHGNLVQNKTSTIWHFPGQPYHNISTTTYNYTFNYINSTLVGSQVEDDWGWHNTIQNIGEYNNPPHTWRILTKREWEQLLLLNRNISCPSKPNNFNCVFREVNQTYGLIVFPDNYSNNNSIPETISTTDWVSYENAGCIFLPAHHKITGTPKPSNPALNPPTVKSELNINENYNKSNCYGYYAMADSYSTDGNCTGLKCYYFTNTNAHNCDAAQPSCGVCVRLVHDLN